MNKQWDHNNWQAICDMQLMYAEALCSFFLSFSSFSVSLKGSKQIWQRTGREKNVPYLPARSILKRLETHSTISSPGWDGQKYSYG